MTECKSVVSIVRCGSYEPREVRTAVESAMELAGLRERLPGGGGVLLKPNLLSTRRPEEAVTTHPEVVRAVGEIALEAGCRLAIGDSPPFAGENPARYAKLCELTGTTAVAEALGARLVRFEEDSVRLDNPDGRFYRSFEIGREVAEADLLISISKLKTHGLTVLTGAVKNLFGCVPGVRKGLFHVQSAEDPVVFAQMLVDLVRALPPTVHVMDAVVAMEGEGPNSGRTRQIGLIMASADPVALDAVACAVVGVDPMSLHTTRLAHEQGLGCRDLGRVEVRGESVGSVRVEGFELAPTATQWTRIPGPIRSLLRRQLVASPRMRAAECSGCGDCSRVCPVQAITPGKPPNVDLTKCIRCYCCQEVCNYSAVELKIGLLGSLLSRRERKK